MDSRETSCNWYCLNSISIEYPHWITGVRFVKNIDQCSAMIDIMVWETTLRLRRILCRICDRWTDCFGGWGVIGDENRDKFWETGMAYFVLMAVL